MTAFAVPIRPQPTVPVQGSDLSFPVRRILCVGRNYAAHAREMGADGRDPPFFFTKPADAVVPPGADVPYPTATSDLHHEIELVVAIGEGGSIFGFAVGVDLTRRDLQTDMKKQGRPWCIGKGYDHSAPIGPITPAAQVPGIAQAALSLQVNGTDRQRSNVAKLIWNIGEIIAHLSAAWALQPGDLIYTGTPEGVGAVVAGDAMVVRIDGLESLAVTVG